MSRFVLDASALLAHLGGERGGEAVGEALKEGAVMSAVNWAEVLSKMADMGLEIERFEELLRRKGLLGGLLQIEPFLEEDSLAVAHLRPLSRSFGLSLGDRACLALGLRKNLPILTADRVWERLKLHREFKERFPKLEIHFLR